MHILALTDRSFGECETMHFNFHQDWREQESEFHKLIPCGGTRNPYPKSTEEERKHRTKHCQKVSFRRGSHIGAFGMCFSFNLDITGTALVHSKTHCPKDRAFSGLAESCCI